jgi:hypothetical protein
MVQAPAGAFRVGVTAAAGAALVIGQAPVAAGFNRTVTAPVLTWHIDAELPARVSTSWRRAGPEDLATSGAGGTPASGPAACW